MLRRVLKLVAECEKCKKISEPFEVISYGHPQDNQPDANYFMKDLPFGWGTWRTGGWGATNYTNTQLFCPDCLDWAKEEGYGTIRISEKGPLDGLAEV